MSLALEKALNDVLLSQCPRVFADVADAGTPTPYVVWHLLGGTALTYVEGVQPSERNALVQINTWADDRLAANLLSQQIAAALLAASTLEAEPQGELQAAFEEDTELRGAMQDFSIWAPR